MKTIRLLLICAALCGLANAAACAQGTAFTYQGVLSQGGAGVNGSNDLTFTLYNSVSGGITVGTSNVVNDLRMTNGLFTVTLDFGAGTVNGSDRWLQIAARPGASTGAYTNLVPRQPVTATPYAIYAGGASAAGLSGTISGSQIAPGAIGSIHLSNSVSLWNRSGTSLYYSNGNVGIGTSTPARALTVYSPDHGIEHTDGTVSLGTFLDGTAGYFGTISPHPLRFFVNDGGGLLTVSTNGNVGIGTINPRAKLHVTGSGWFGSDSGALPATAGIGVRVFYDTVTAAGAISAYNYTTGQPANLGLQQPGGNVGIGTTTPATKLHVNGTVTATSFSGDGLGLTGVARLSGGNNFFGNQTVTNGNVGIGTGSPDRPLTLRGAGVNGEWISFKNSADTTKWHMNNSGGGLDFVESGVADYRLFLAPGGNVGIGTGSPASKLDVAGAIRCSSLVVNSDLQIAGEITCTAINLTSDRNAKEQFQPVNGREVLAKVVGLPISEWQYKTQSGARHIGPMAQDFREAFSLGNDEKHIATVDADGVALAAIQGLNEKFEEQLKEKNAELGRLKSENQSLAARLAAIEHALGLPDESVPAPR
jgi:hypothetical protein